MTSPAVINVDDKLLELESKVSDYCAAVPEIKENIQHIRSWVRTQNTSGNETQQTISDVESVVQTSVSSLDDLTSGEPTRIIKGCLNIASSVLTIVGGPYGAAASAICNILVAIISQRSPSKPDMATKLFREIKEEIKKEMQELHQRLEDKKCSGLDVRVENMMEYLKCLNEVSNDETIPDRALFETAFPQFIGEVVENFKYDPKHNEESYKKCVKSVLLFYKAKTTLILLLANVIAACKSSGRETRFIEVQLARAKTTLAESLAFWSNEEEMMRKNNNSRHKTLLAIYVLRNNFACKLINELRESLGMKKMPLLNEIEAIALKACHCYPEDVTDQYERPHTRGDYHYFQLINHTDFPIKVRCRGNGGGSGVKLLKFLQDVGPRSSYEHPATKWYNSLTTGGVFVVYLEGQTRFEETMLQNDGTDMKVFEFALSMPIMGTKKSAIKDRSDDVPSLANAGRDCWNEMRRGDPESPPIYFEVKGEPHIAFSKYSSRGKKNCLTCRFVMQKYDPQKMRLAQYEEPDEVDLGYFEKNKNQKPIFASSKRTVPTGKAVFFSDG